jgi:hypothetical protein
MDPVALILFGLLLALCAALSTVLLEEYQLSVRAQHTFMDCRRVCIGAGLWTVVLTLAWWDLTT